MIDERIASWKLYLPCNPEAKVLVVGLEMGVITSLARTWKRVDCYDIQDNTNFLYDSRTELRERITMISSRRGLRQEYNIIILAANLQKNLFSINDAVHLLAEDGKLVCMNFAGNRIKQKDLYKAGYVNVNTYSAIPAASPRIFFPISSKETIFKSLCFHSPGSAKAKLMIKLAQMLNKIGFKAHLAKSSVVIAEREKKGADKVTL